jgi:hypothetical protein
VPEMVDRDQEHLRLLTLCYYLLAGTTAFFSLFALLYVAFGAIVLSGVIPQSQSSNDDPRIVGYVLAGIGGAIFLLGIVSAILYFLVARGLRDRRSRTLCFAMACLTCLYIPFGTAIGVCTIQVLNRPEVKRLFSPGEPIPQGIV